MSEPEAEAEIPDVFHVEAQMNAEEDKILPRPGGTHRTDNFDTIELAQDAAIKLSGRTRNGVRLCVHACVFRNGKLIEVYREGKRS